MRKLGFHRLLLADGTLVNGPLVVQVDDEGSILSWHPMHGEEESTEWVGGTWNAAEPYI